MYKIKEKRIVNYWGALRTEIFRPTVIGAYYFGFIAHGIQVKFNL